MPTPTINPFGLLGWLQRKFTFKFEPRPIIWTRRRFRFVRWYHNDPDGAIWRAHRDHFLEEYGPEKANQPRDGPSDPIGWISFSVSPSFYVALNLPWVGGKTLHARYGGRYQRAEERTPQERGVIIRPSIALKVVSEPFIW